MKTRVEAVLIDFHRHTYLLAERQGRSLRVIPLDPGGLRVRLLKPAQQRELGVRELDYPVQVAVTRFRRCAQCWGCNKAAAKVLRTRAHQPRRTPPC